jgi:hypothetical protein
VVATLMVAVAALVVAGAPSDQLLLLHVITHRTPWAPQTSAPLAGTSWPARILSAHTV